MDTNEARSFLYNFARYGCVQSSKHCRDMMYKRNISMDDILFVLMWGEIVSIERDAERQNYKCKLEDKDLDGDNLVFVAVINEKKRSILCITVY